MDAPPVHVQMPACLSPPGGLPYQEPLDLYRAARRLRPELSGYCAPPLP